MKQDLRGGEDKIQMNRDGTILSHSLPPRNLSKP